MPKLRTQGEPKSRDSEPRRELYLYARKLYFISKVINIGEIAHVFTSAEISKKISQEFHVNLPASTIRRWSVTPDKELQGLTWQQEWDRRINTGILQAASGTAENEQSAKLPQPIINKVLSPMESLTEMSRESLRNDINMVTKIEKLFNVLSNEIEEEITLTGKVNLQKMKVLLPYYVSAKEHFFENIDKIKEIEKSMDSELLYGSRVWLADPAARERVRNAVLAVMDISYKLSTEQEQKNQELPQLTQ